MHDYDRLDELREARALLADELAEAAECVRYHHDGADPAKMVGEYPELTEWRRCAEELAAWDEENAAELVALEATTSPC
jgi:hypothetical protein